MKILPQALCCLALLTACASAPNNAGGPREVTIAQLAADPLAFDGRRVRVRGYLVAEFENFGLYASPENVCVEDGTDDAIYVDSEEATAMVGGLGEDRHVLLEGVFQFRVPRVQPNGDLLISTGAPGPGPLTQLRIVERLPGRLKACP